MLVGSVSGFNPSQYANSLKNCGRVLSDSNAVAADTVSFGGGIQKVKPTHLGIGGALVLGLLALAGCAQPTSPTITPETPVTPVTPVTPDVKLLDVEKNFINVMSPLDPIVETTPESLAAKGTSDTSTSAVKSFSYELDDWLEKFEVTSVDSTNGTVTANHSSKSLITGVNNTSEEVKLAKTDTGFKVIYSGGAYEDFSILDGVVHRNNVGKTGKIVLERTLQKGNTAGDVLALDKAGAIKEAWTSFKVVLSEAASNLLSETTTAKLLKAVRK